MPKFKVQMKQYVEEIYETEVEAADEEEAIEEAHEGDWELIKSYSNGGEEYRVISAGEDGIMKIINDGIESKGEKK